MNQETGMMKNGAVRRDFPGCYSTVKKAVTSDPLLDSFHYILIFEVSVI